MIRNFFRPDYIICFWDKSRIRVSGEVGEKIKSAIKSNSVKYFEFGKNLYSLAGVEKIITIDEAFAVFPTEYETLNGMQNQLPTKETMLALEAENKNPEGLKRLEGVKNK